MKYDVKRISPAIYRQDLIRHLSHPDFLSHLPQVNSSVYCFAWKIGGLLLSTRSHSNRRCAFSGQYGPLDGHESREESEKRVRARRNAVLAEANVVLDEDILKNICAEDCLFFDKWNLTRGQSIFNYCIAVNLRTGRFVRACPKCRAVLAVLGIEDLYQDVSAALAQQKGGGAGAGGGGGYGSSRR